MRKHEWDGQSRDWQPPRCKVCGDLCNPAGECPGPPGDPFADTGSPARRAFVDALHGAAKTAVRLYPGAGVRPDADRRTDERAIVESYAAVCRAAGLDVRERDASATTLESLARDVGAMSTALMTLEERFAELSARIPQPTPDAFSEACADQAHSDAAERNRVADLCDAADMSGFSAALRAGKIESIQTWIATIDQFARPLSDAETAARVGLTGLVMPPRETAPVYVSATATRTFGEACPDEAERERVIAANRSEQ